MSQLKPFNLNYKQLADKAVEAIEGLKGFTPEVIEKTGDAIQPIIKSSAKVISVVADSIKDVVQQKVINPQRQKAEALEIHIRQQNVWLEYNVATALEDFNLKQLKSAQAFINKEQQFIDKQHFVRLKFYHAWRDDLYDKYEAGRYSGKDKHFIKHLEQIDRFIDREYDFHGCVTFGLAQIFRKVGTLDRINIGTLTNLKLKQRIIYGRY